MGQSNTQTYQNEVKAAHEYKVMDANGKPSVAGRRFHFIGAGGIGMSGLAKLLVKHKAIVAGSDQTVSGIIDKLCELGADIKIGHRADNLNPETDAVVISAVIKDDNPEFKLARKRGCKIYKYAQMLGELMNCYDGIAVSGTHGKSTTSGWLIYLLKQAGLDPSFIIGADITQLAGSSGTGNGKFFIAEACEYDRSFLNLKPSIAAILNIEQDHLDYYKDEDEIVDAFGEFALGTREGGVLIANGTDSNVAKAIGRLPAGLRCETFGLDKKCNFSAQKLEPNDGLYSFDIYHNGQPPEHLRHWTCRSSFN